MSTVSYMEIAASDVSKKEILRYMGCKESSAEIVALIDSALSECIGSLSSAVVYREFQITRHNGSLDLGFTVLKSKTASKALDGCDKIILFSATLGLSIDRMIMKYGRLSPSRAVCLQAIGAERIEALCDAFCDFIKEKYKNSTHLPTPRFSAGYGDIPLSLQKDIFSALECEKHLGLTLNDSLIMSPSKSVTAIIGLKK